jgi:hypothetical protein
MVIAAGPRIAIEDPIVIFEVPPKSTRVIRQLRESNITAKIQLRFRLAPVKRRYGKSGVDMQDVVRCLFARNGEGRITFR